MYKTLGKIDLENEELMIGNAPKFTNERKRAFFEKARKVKGKSLSGSITVTRVTPDTQELESTVFEKGKTKFREEPGYFMKSALTRRILQI